MCLRYNRTKANNENIRYMCIGLLCKYNRVRFPFFTKNVRFLFQFVSRFIWLFCECYICAWAVASAAAAADVVAIVFFSNRYCLSHRIMFTFICVVLSFCLAPFILVPYLCLEIET